jgi:predicted DCC family thiol-disulfide oxidoreductase YuxK
MIPTDMARDATDSMSSNFGATRRAWTVLYDADCGFCRWSLARVLALDRARVLRPVALGTPDADALLEDLTHEQRDASWHLVSPDGRRFSAGAAAPPLLRLLYGGRLPAAVLARAPKLSETAYRWIADHRSTLSRMIPQRAKERATDRIAQHWIGRG